MAVERAIRRLRGAFGTRWCGGTGWFTAALAVFATLRVAGILTVPWEEVLVAAMKTGIWEMVLDDGLWTAVFGGAAAAGSLKLAQRAGASGSSASASSRGILGEPPAD